MKREMWDIDIDMEAPDAEAQIDRVKGMARASLGFYTTKQDLQALVHAVKDLCSRKQEILDNYDPVGTNGYRHKQFQPPLESIFDAGRSLQQALARLTNQRGL